MEIRYQRLTMNLRSYPKLKRGFFFPRTFLISIQELQETSMQDTFLSPLYARYRTVYRIGLDNRENPVIAHILDKGREIMILDYL